MESQGIHIIDAPVYGNFDVFKFYVRESDLPAIEKAVEKKIGTEKKDQLEKQQAEENKKISTTFQSAVTPKDISKLMDFKAKLEDRGPRDLIAEAEAAVKIASAATEIRSIGDSSDTLISFLKNAYTQAKSDKNPVGLDESAMLKNAAKLFVDARKLSPTLEEMGVQI